jgi:hypothetical protein
LVITPHATRAPESPVGWVLKSSLNETVPAAVLQVVGANVAVALCAAARAAKQIASRPARGRP